VFLQFSQLRVGLPQVEILAERPQVRVVIRSAIRPGNSVVNVQPGSDAFAAIILWRTSVVLHFDLGGMSGVVTQV